MPSRADPITNAVLFYGLIFILVGIIVSAGLWAIGSFSNNYTQSVTGRRGFLWFAAAGLIVSVFTYLLQLYGSANLAHLVALLAPFLGLTAAVAGYYVGRKLQLTGRSPGAMADSASRSQHGPLYSASDHLIYADLLTKGAEQLASPSLGGRLGGIYILQGAAQGYPSLRPAVVEILSAFIRAHRPTSHEHETPEALNAANAVADVEAAALALAGLPQASEPLDLHGADLSGMRLAELDLRYADLTEASFRGTDLSGARLDGAKLRDADFERAYAVGTSFLVAVMPGANFFGASLASANFERALLSEADFRTALAPDASFVGSLLANADFRDADCRRADFSEAFLEGAAFAGAFLESARLSLPISVQEIQLGESSDGLTTPPGRM